MVRQSSLIIKIVLGILVGMSVGSWTLIFFKLFQLGKVRKKAAADLSRFEKAPDLRTAIRLIDKDPDSPVYQITAEGVKELNRLKKGGQSFGEKAEAFGENLRQLLHEEVNAQTERLFGSLSFLATCVNVAPFLGLFGTVWGIMHSFYAIGLMKRATLAAVALGLSEALTTTAMGLAVAIPASLAYNFLTGTLGRVERDLIRFTAVFLHQVKGERSLRRKDSAIIGASLPQPSKSFVFGSCNQELVPKN